MINRPLSNSKTTLRAHWKQRRSHISKERRHEASLLLFERLSECLSSYSAVISFASLSEEIDTKLFNQYLLNKKGLYLPLCHQDTLEIYQVDDLNSLIPTPFGLEQPDPKKCKKISTFENVAVLVPALCFDRSNHRLGYGKGFYDRFLQTFPHLFTVGVGFQEQFIEKLPAEKHDIPLSRLFLF